MFGTLGAPELLIILVIVVVLFGVGKLGDIGGAMGKSIREFKKSVADDESKPTESNAEEPAG